MGFLLAILDIIKKNQYYAWVLGLALLTGFWVYERYNELIKEQKALAVLEQSVRVMQRNTKEAVGLDKDSEQMNQIGVALDKRLLEVTRKAANVGAFYALASQTKVVIRNVVQDPSVLFKKQDGFNYISIPYAASFSGTFEQISAFLVGVKQNPHFILVSSIEVQNEGLVGPKKEALDSVNVSMRISALGKENGNSPK